MVSVAPRIDTDYAYRGIDAAVLENRRLRVEVLTGKGGDVVEFQDKRRGVNVLFEAEHNWQPPDRRVVPPEGESSWNDSYPGGWQVNLPVAGAGRDIDGNAYGQHGESALIPWDASVVRDDDEAVTLRLSTELVRYPFYVERELTLPAEGSRLLVEESVTNRGGVELEYVWQQHVALGPPLLGPTARLDVPARTGLVEEYGDGYPNARLASGEQFEWPTAPGRDGEPVDLTSVPPPDAGVHDMGYILDLEAGWYALTNPEIDLGFAFTFPIDPFECVWHWQPYGGYQESPFFNRTYNVGLEPTTAYPSDAESQRTTGTMKTLGPGESVSARFVATTYTGIEAVSSVAPDGTVTSE